jgi:hypothetical protein
MAFSDAQAGWQDRALDRSLADARARDVERMERCVAAAREDPRQGLHACVTELFAMLSLPGALGYAGVLVREHRRLSERYPLELRVALAPLIELIARHIERATASENPRRDAETMFRILLQGIDDVIVGRVSDPAELGEYLWKFCWQGLEG